MPDIIRLTAEHVNAAADLHRVAGALIPGYDTSLHTSEEYRVFYKDDVMQKDELWGIFDGDALLGFIALLPGWIDHLYVHPTAHRQGIGTALVQFAQSQQAELRLYTFQANANARALYERTGFHIEEMTDGQRNEEKMPDITFLWNRGN